MIAPRRLVCYGLLDGEGEGPTRAEFLRAQALYRRLEAADRVTWGLEADRASVMTVLADALDRGLANPGGSPAPGDLPGDGEWEAGTRARALALEAWYQRLAARSGEERATRWARVYTSPSAYRESIRPMLRAYQDLLGDFPKVRGSLAPKSEKVYETERVVGYRLLLEVYPDVHGYGILLMPRSLLTGDRIARERRPAVICQHGFRGRPEYATGIVDSDQDATYQKFGLRLAERGYVVFAPYIVVPDSTGVNAIVRKAALTGRTRVGLDLVKMGRVIDFLSRLPCVDPKRIGFYGLSYGGYTALWTAPGEPRYAAVVVSGHFNDWVPKTTNLQNRTSYLFHPDEDMYNLGVLNLFNHSDLASLIAPRPLFVEHGQQDAVAPSEWALPEFERARAHYARLGVPERIEIDRFPGPHRIWGDASFRFLDRWLGRR
jgi:fermentation-respiration switch protein FrsA (DUF1100 family)